MQAFSTDLRAALTRARTESQDPQGDPWTRHTFARALGVNERTVRRVELGHTQTVKGWLLDRWLRVTGRRLTVTLEEA